MGDDRSEADPDADALNRTGEEPAADSGAGYGDHAPAPDEAKERAESRE